jgi:hypothetical protein
MFFLVFDVVIFVVLTFPRFNLPRSNTEGGSFVVVVVVDDSTAWRQTIKLN